MIAPPGAILCYHSVTSARWPSASPVNVPDGEFVAALDVVRRFAEIVPLREIVNRHRVGRSTNGLVALTFDDAYAALPEVIGAYIARDAVPITIFVTSGATDRGARFWWDRVDDLHPRVPSERWRAFEDAIGLPDAYRVGQPTGMGPLRPLRQWILAEYRGRWPEHLDAPLAALEAEREFVTVQRAMTWDEVARFAASASIDVGVHTASHPVLPLLDEAECEREIASAHHAIKERVANAVPVLAIPFGLYDARTEGIARRAGMRASLTLANRSLRAVGADAPLPRLSMARGLRRWKLALRLIAPRGAPASYPALPSATS
jgi:peptidoglycan/xylan/chitin deacetylase (PgdA/CDA1 family)